MNAGNAKYSQQVGQIKSEGVRPRKKKEAEASSMNAWVSQSNASMQDYLQLDKIAANPNDNTLVDNLVEAVKEAKNNAQPEIDPGPAAGVPDFALDAAQSLTEKEVDERVSIVVSVDQEQICNVKEGREKFQIRSDVHKLINSRVHALTCAIADLTQQLLAVKRDHMDKTDVMMIDKETWAMCLGKEISLPAAHLKNGKGAALKECLVTFAQVVFSLEEWNDNLIINFREGSGQHLAILAAKKLRAAKGGATIPTGGRVECKELGDAIILSEQFGPAPKEKEVKKLLTLTGAFRGYHRDERKSFFSPNESSQGKTKTLNFKEDAFDRIRALATDEFTQCSVNVCLYFIGERLDHIELVDIKGGTKDMHQVEGAPGGNAK